MTTIWLVIAGWKDLPSRPVLRS